MADAHAQGRGEGLNLTSRKPLWSEAVRGRAAAPPSLVFGALARPKGGKRKGNPKPSKREPEGKRNDPAGVAFYSAKNFNFNLLFLFYNNNNNSNNNKYTTCYEEIVLYTMSINLLADLVNRTIVRTTKKTNKH